MAAVVRYYAEFKDRKGKSWRVEFCDKDFTGTATEVTLGADAFSLSWNGNANEPHQPIVTSSADFYLVVQTTGVYDWLLELPNAEPDRFTVAIKRGTTWQYTRWAGVLMVDGIEIEDIYLPQQVTLKANDDLARLQDVLYKAAPTAEFSGDAYIHEHLRNCLLKLRTMQHWEDTDVLLKIVPYLRPAADTADGIKLTILKHEHLHNANDAGEKQYLSVWKVLEEIAYLYSARIFLEQGQFWLQPLSACIRDPLKEKLLDVWNYTKGGTMYSSTDLPVFNDFSTDIERIRGWRTTFLPRIKRVEREYNSGDTLVLGYLPSLPYQFIPMVGGAQMVDLSINWTPLYSPLSGSAVTQAGYLPRLTFQYKTSSDAVSGLTGNNRAVRWRVDIYIKLVGSTTTNYLNRTTTHDTTDTTPYIVGNGDLVEVSGVDYGAPTWGTNSANKASIITTAIDGSNNYAIQELLEIDLPEVTETAIVFMHMAAHAIDADGVEIDTPHAEVLYQWAGGIQLYPSQGEQLTADSYLYYAEQDEGREVITLPTAIVGDAVGSNSLNFLEFGTSATTVWEQIDESAQEPIHQLVVREILAYRAKALEIRSGTARCMLLSNQPTGILPFGYTLTEGTDIYVCLNMTWHAAQAQYDLQLCKFVRDTTVITSDGGDIPVLGMPAVNGGAVQLSGLRNSQANPSTRSQQANITAALRQSMRSSERTTLGYINATENILLDDVGTVLSRITGDYKDDEGNLIVKAPIGQNGAPALSIYKINPDSTTQSTVSIGLKVADNMPVSYTITLPKYAPVTGTELLIFNSSGQITNLTDGSTGEVLTTDGSGAISWAAAAGGGASDGWHGSTTLLKVMPTEFIMNDDYSRFPLMVEDDVSGKLGIKTMSTGTELYAFVAIPTGYKATHVQVYTSANVSNAVTAYSFDQTTGDIVSKGTGNFNASIDITDITSSSTSSITIKAAPASSSIIIYGADITLLAI